MMKKIKINNIMEMNELLMQMFEKAKGRKDAFIAMKNLAVKTQQFELAANIREIEKELFPETEEVKKAKESAKNVNLLFRMVEINTDEKTSWLLFETVKKYLKRKGNFDVKDATELMFKQKEIFE